MFTDIMVIFAIILAPLFFILGAEMGLPLRRSCRGCKNLRKIIEEREKRIDEANRSLMAEKKRYKNLLNCNKRLLEDNKSLREKAAWLTNVIWTNSIDREKARLSSKESELLEEESDL